MGHFKVCPHFTVIFMTVGINIYQFHCTYLGLTQIIWRNRYFKILLGNQPNICQLRFLHYLWQQQVFFLCIFFIFIHYLSLSSAIISMLFLYIHFRFSSTCKWNHFISHIHLKKQTVDHIVQPEWDLSVVLKKGMLYFWGNWTLFCYQCPGNYIFIDIKKKQIHKYLLKLLHFKFVYVIKNYAHIQICCVK